MMKKALLYSVTAILLGTVTMVAPLMLLKPGYYAWITSGGENLPWAFYPPVLAPAPETLGGGEFLAIPEEGARTLNRGEALERAVSPSSLLSVGLMLVPSFLLALGVSLYLKKRMF
jgi:hypothetical protein